MTILLEVKNLTKTYGQETAADNVSFALEEHTSTALIGPNGAGKTTTLSMLAGLVSPTRGQYHFKIIKHRIFVKLLGFYRNIQSFFRGYQRWNLQKWRRV